MDYSLEGAVTLSDLVIALKDRFKQPEGVVLFEVRNSTGFPKEQRIADAIAVDMYPSRGCDIHGFEFKSSRSDVLVELKNPKKAEAIFQYCNRWWLVTTDPKIIHVDEVPSTWGLMVPRGSALVVKKPAPELQPIAVSRPFLASLLRSAMQQLTDEAEVQKRITIQVRKEVMRLRGIDKTVSDQQMSQSAYQLKRLEESVKEFEEVSGITINSWNGGELGRMVKFLRENPVDRLLHNMKLTESSAQQVVDYLSSVHEVIEEIKWPEE